MPESFSPSNMVWGVNILIISSPYLLLSLFFQYKYLQIFYVNCVLCFLRLWAFMKPLKMRTKSVVNTPMALIYCTLSKIYSWGLRGIWRSFAKVVALSLHWVAKGILIFVTELYFLMPRKTLAPSHLTVGFLLYQRCIFVYIYTFFTCMYCII